MFSKLIKYLPLVFILLVQLIMAGRLNYPPTTEQLLLGLNNSAQLWLLRLVSLGLVFVSIYLFSALIDRKLRWLFWLLVFVSPAIFITWVAYPLEVLKSAILSGIIFLSFRKKINWILGICICVVALLTINVKMLKQGPTFISYLSLKTAQQEVTTRITTEDSVNPNVHLPLIFRRSAYNKYSILIKNIFNQVMSSLDFESIFFQEMHPLGIKSLVIFYWPEIGLFLLSLWLLSQNKLSINKQALLLAVTLSVLNYLLSNDSAYKRLLFNVPIVVLLMVSSIKFLQETETVFSKIFLFGVGILTFWGFVNFLYDFNIRPEFWLDNRPLVYQKLLTSPILKNLHLYDKIYLSDILGDASKYCTYYLSDCSKFSFANFDLSKQLIERRTLYMGFVGNFYGSLYSNNFPIDHTTYFSLLNIKLLTNYSISDNVANQYGSQLVIAESIIENEK